MSMFQLIESDPIPLQRVLRCTARDAARLLAHLPPVAEREVPGTAGHAYLDGYIVKPWGHELRVYDDAWVDVWRLAIEAGKGTSLHAHPRKETSLICIGGAGVLETGAGEQIALAEGIVVHIRPCALHRTFTDEGVSLIEVELPRDKFDLVRIGDSYGRTGQRYEGAEAAEREPCPLHPHPAGPPRARLRRHCATGCFRFALETCSQTALGRHDLVASVLLDTSSVLDHELIVYGGGVPAATMRDGLYLTVRSNHR